MPRYSSRKASFIQNFNYLTNTYSPKSLFHLSSLECFEDILEIEYGNAKLITGNLDCFPLTVQEKLYWQLNSMWETYSSSFSYNFIKCSKHFDLNEGEVYPCCQKCSHKISNVQLDYFKIV